MEPLDETIAAYDREAGALVARYEGLAFEEVHGGILDLLPQPPAIVLDVGAGSGRDAAALAERGYRVVAVEPSAAMRRLGQRFHPSAAITWLDDRLPGLDRTSALGARFDLILLSAVFPHVPPAGRAAAFAALAGILAPGGLLVLSLRHGPPPPARATFDVSRVETERLAAGHGLEAVRRVVAADLLGRDDVQWETMCYRALPR